MSVWAQSPNPTVNRLTNDEIRGNSTPSAVAYNFVNAVVQENYELMESYLGDVVDYSTSKENRFAEYHKMFSTPGKLNILGWKKAIGAGYEVAVLYVQNEGLLKKVYVNLVSTSEVGSVGFQDITRYDPDINPKVLLQRDGNEWKVLGFK